MRTLNIDPAKVTAVLLADGWHSARQFQLLSLEGPAKWATAVGFQDSDYTYVFAPTSALLGLKTRDLPKTPEEIAEEEAERQYREAALFEWQHYAPREVYERAAAEQGGKCPGPLCQGADLTAYPITHYVKSEGKVYCQMDSPLKPRYGEPA